jgi:hypothetical protein
MTSVESRLKSVLDQVAERVDTAVPARVSARLTEQTIAKRSTVLSLGVATLVIMAMFVGLRHLRSSGQTHSVGIVPATQPPTSLAAHSIVTDTQADQPTIPDTSTPTDSKVPADSTFDFYTHCGIQGAMIAGQWWTTQGQNGTSSIPPGWADPIQTGTLHFVDQQTATFGFDGSSVVLTLRNTSSDLPPQLCH